MRMKLMDMADGEDSAPPKETMMFDVTEEEVKEFSVGDEITVVIKGKVGMVQEPQYSEPSEDNPCTMGIKVDSKKIITAGPQQQAANALLDPEEDSED